MKKNDLIELAGLIETSIIDDFGCPESQKKVAKRLLALIRKEYRGIPQK